MSDKYTILSIGPIYDTMQIADNTRAMWTVSFMFSYLIRETIRTLKDKHADDFLVPNLDDDAFGEYLKDGQRVGLFHDRLILKYKHADDIKKAFECSVDNLAEIIVSVFKKTKEENFTYVKVDVDETEVRRFIKGYFQSYIAEVEIEDGKNPILELSRYVDAVEYEPALPPYEEKEFLFLFFRLTNLGLLQKIAYKEEAYNTLKERCFNSLPEISAWELIKTDIEKWKKEHLCLKIDEAEQLEQSIKNPDDEAEEIIKKLEKEFKCKRDGSVKPCFKPYHKYVAIVHGDGDSFSKYLESIGSDESAIKRFSSSVFAFMTSAREAIRECGGYPIVGSGEDLLFFAPVINGKENIFSLINRIDRIFKSHFDDPVLSMSYGMSITYYKYPLQEALELSVKALWDNAKEAQWLKRSCFERDPHTKPVREKNAVHIHIQKHSGQSHSLTLPKDTKLYEEFIALINQELDANDDLHLPHSLHHSLDRVATVIDATPASRIEHLFANFFNEDIHKVKHKKALQAVQTILKKLKQSDEAIHLLQDSKLTQPSQTIFAMLSIIKMLRGGQMSRVTYKITLRPIGAFYFGGEESFTSRLPNSILNASKDVVKSYFKPRQEYFAKSEMFPQQTQLLGMLRKELLRIDQKLYYFKNFLSVPSSLKGDAQALVGDIRWTPEGELRLGQIVSISPVVLQKADKLYIAAPFDECRDSMSR